MRGLLIGLALVLGCATGIPQTPVTLISSKPVTVKQAKTAMTASLRNPDSARFMDLYVTGWSWKDGSPDAHAVCGRVNAHNAYGGYTGFKPFIYLRAAGRDRVSVLATPAGADRHLWYIGLKACNVHPTLRHDRYSPMVLGSTRY